MLNKQCILISRQPKADSSLRHFADSNGLTLVEQSFIETKAILNLSIPETNWVFFSSPSGARLFLENYQLNHQKIAVLGPGTQRTLTDLGKKVHYTGPAHLSPAEIGKDFLKQIQPNEKVLFPLSQISRKSVSGQFPDENKVEIVTYETLENSLKLDVVPAIIIFTSPSNIDGFLQENSLDPNTKLICLGETSHNYLKQLGIPNQIIEAGSLEEDWLKAINQLIKQ
jgi:uroporphyrinogen-III synthase